MAGTVKKDGSNWYFVFSAGKKQDGKPRQIKRRGFKTKREAEKALNEAQNSFYQGTLIQENKMLYEDYLNEWFEMKKTTIGLQTAAVYHSILKNHITPSLGKHQLSKLTTMAIQSFVNKLHQKGMASKSVKKIFEVVRNSLEHATDFELIKKKCSF